jgi:lambda repressor-like predicted transcriptional regulator
LDYLLQRTAKALKSWSAKHVGSIRFQLFAARELVAQLDTAQDSRSLFDEEHELRRELKRESLGLASLARTIARQRSRIRFLGEGDANTRFFHLQAYHRNRKNVITTLQHEGQSITAEEAKADLIYEYYNDILGKPFTRMHGINLQQLGIPQLELERLGDCFTEAEI